MEYQELYITGASAASVTRLVTYDSEPEVAGRSTVTFDRGGRIESTHILPQDLDVFRPILEALLPPEPATITVRGQTLTLASDLRAAPLQTGGSDKRVWSVRYEPVPITSKISSLLINEDGVIIRNGIQPDHVAHFAPILAITEPAP
jgi:hypothetical protein